VSWSRPDLAEEIVGYHFTDLDVARVALETWRQGFSRLEFLGDAILGLAVGIDAVNGGHGRSEAIHAVCNEVLDRKFRQLLADCTSANTGDVLEALIGAVLLDGDFATAATVAVQLCGWSESWDEARTSDREMSERDWTFVGALVLSAVVADHLCRTNPSATHEWYSQERSQLLRRSRLWRISVAKGWARHQEHPSDEYIRRASDELERRVAEAFIHDGWNHSYSFMVSLGVLQQGDEFPASS
jgi:dsRNA-specific ribonuclease